LLDHQMNWGLPPFPQAPLLLALLHQMVEAWLVTRLLLWWAHRWQLGHLWCCRNIWRCCWRCRALKVLVESLWSKLRSLTAEHPTLHQQGLQRWAVGLEPSRSQLVTQTHIFKVKQRELRFQELHEWLVLSTLMALVVPCIAIWIQISLGIRWGIGFPFAVLATGLTIRALKLVCNRFFLK